MPSEYAMTVEVLRFDEEAAYDHNRPISSLIRTQLLHLHTAENLVLPPKDRTGININHLLTERQASEYIQKVTALLHGRGKATKRRAAAGGKAITGKRAAKKAGRASGGKAAGGKTKKTGSAARQHTSRK